jgi:hypothetical protein
MSRTALPVSPGRMGGLFCSAFLSRLLQLNLGELRAIVTSLFYVSGFNHLNIGVCQASCRLFQNIFKLTTKPRNVNEQDNEYDQHNFFHLDLFF